MLKTIAFAVAIAVISFPALSSPTNQGSGQFMSTAQLLSMCRDNSAYSRGVCEGYLMSMADEAVLELESRNSRPCGRI